MFTLRVGIMLFKANPRTKGHGIIFLDDCIGTVLITF